MRKLVELNVVFLVHLKRMISVQELIWLFAVQSCLILCKVIMELRLFEKKSTLLRFANINAQISVSKSRLMSLINFVAINQSVFKSIIYSAWERRSWNWLQVSLNNENLLSSCGKVWKNYFKDWRLWHSLLLIKLLGNSISLFEFSLSCTSWSSHVNRGIHISLTYRRTHVLWVGYTLLSCSTKLVRLSIPEALFVRQSWQWR